MKFEEMQVLFLNLRIQVLKSQIMKVTELLEIKPDEIFPEI
jgi:hypothetical protein